MSTHRAAWIFPVAQPPLRDAVLTTEDGHILSVEPYRGQAVDHDHGDAAILPGLVNAHIHLDLGALHGKLSPPEHFTDWLKHVIAYRRSSSVEEWDAAIIQGIRECLRSGTTLVGDISAGGRSLAPLRTSPLRGVVFYELIGLNRERAEQTWQAAREWLEQFSPRPGTLGRGGPVPSRSQPARSLYCRHVASRTSSDICLSIQHAPGHAPGRDASRMGTAGKTSRPFPRLLGKSWRLG